MIGESPQRINRGMKRVTGMRKKRIVANKEQIRRI